nr:MAG TPA: hypothetical protein [Caudoviricetes sp.]
MTIEGLFRALGDELSPAQWKNIVCTTKISTAIALDRISRKMTEGEFAKLLGVPKRRVIEYESGDYDFAVKELCEISTKLGIEFDIVFENMEVKSDVNKE